MIVRGIEEGKNLNQISADLRQLQAEERAAATTARQLEQAHAQVESRMQVLRSALANFGLALGARESVQLALDLANSARAANDARAALEASTKGAIGYEEAITAAKEATRGMVSEQELASSLTTIFGSGLADSATEAASLAAAGTTLVNVFKDAGASMSLYTRFLNSGSRELSNNFGVSEQLIASIQKQIEASGRAAGNEARILAVRQAVIETAKQYQSALSDDAVAAARFDASLQDAKASLGQFILPEVTRSAENFGFALTELTAALDTIPPSAASAGGGLLDLLNPLGTINSIIESFQGITEELSSSTDEAAAAQEGVAAAAALAATSYGATESMADSLIGKQLELADAANLAASAFGNQRTEAEAAAAVALSTANTLDAANQAAGAFGGGQDQFTNNRMLAGIRQAGDARLASQAEQKRQEEQASRESEQNAKRQATATAKAFEQAGDQIGNTISSKLQTTFQEVFKLPDEGAEHADEPARRLATVAAAGFGSEWLTQLNQQFQGTSFWAPIAAAMQSGNEAELKVAATTALRNFSNGLVKDLWDVNIIKAQIRQETQATNLRQQLTEEIAKELGPSGIAQSIGVVNIAAGDVKTAQAEVQQSTTDMAANVVKAGPEMEAALDGSITKLQIVNQLIREAIGLTERWGEVTKGAVDNFNNIGPGAATQPNAGPTNSQVKMGGVTRIQ